MNNTYKKARTQTQQIPLDGLRSYPRHGQPRMAAHGIHSGTQRKTLKERILAAMNRTKRRKRSEGGGSALHEVIHGYTHDPAELTKLQAWLQYRSQESIAKLGLSVRAVLVDKCPQWHYGQGTIRHIGFGQRWTRYVFGDPGHWTDAPESGNGST